MACAYGSEFLGGTQGPRARTGLNWCGPCLGYWLGSDGPTGAFAGYDANKTPRTDATGTPAQPSPLELGTCWALH